MSKPETTFYTSVHKHLPSVDELYREKMSNPYRGGTADHWYSRNKDLWVEWKFIVVPKRDETLIDLVGGKKPLLSALQQDWLRGRSREGRQVAVIVGSKDGGMVMAGPEVWELPLAAAEFRKWMQTRKEIAAWIERKTS